MTASNVQPPRALYCVVCAAGALPKPVAKRCQLCKNSTNATRTHTLYCMVFSDPFATEGCRVESCRARFHFRISCLSLPNFLGPIGAPISLTRFCLARVATSLLALPCDCTAGAVAVRKLLFP